MATRRARLIATLAIALGLCGVGLWVLWQTRGVRVAVRNLGPGALSGVVVHVTGNSYPIGDLNVGDARTVAVQCRGESGVQLEFKDAAGQRTRVDAGGYFESSHYRGVIEVDLEDGEIKRVEDRVRISLY